MVGPSCVLGEPENVFARTVGLAGVVMVSSNFSVKNESESK